MVGGAQGGSPGCSVAVGVGEPGAPGRLPAVQSTGERAQQSVLWEVGDSCGAMTDAESALRSCGVSRVEAGARAAAPARYFQHVSLLFWK